MKERLNKYFTRDEFACKCGCGYHSVDVELLDVLIGLREHYNAPVRINSGCRCEKHNNEVSTSSKSKHLLACAADIKISGITAHETYKYLDKNYPDEYGLGLHLGFVHLDIRSTKWRREYND